MTVKFAHVVTVLQLFCLCHSRCNVNITEDCPTWTHRLNNGSKECVCGDVTREIVLCGNKSLKVEILDGYIITYNYEKNMVEAGQSLYGWRRLKINKGKTVIYFHVDCNQEKLNHSACAKLNRKGRLCGKCKEGFSPLVYSYDLHCVNCTNSHLNWVKFIAVAFIPLTAFYIFVIFFKFNANSPALQAYILGAQTMASPATCRFIKAKFHQETNSFFLFLFFLKHGILTFSDSSTQVCA